MISLYRALCQDVPVAYGDARHRAVGRTHRRPAGNGVLEIPGGNPSLNLLPSGLLVTDRNPDRGAVMSEIAW